METIFSQIGPWLFFLSLGSGMGVPLGIPPGPDDPVISRVAPQECAFYTMWSSIAAPDARSKNQAELMLTEPEVRLFLEHLERWGRHAINQSAERERNSLNDATFDTMLTVLRHQTAIFISDVKVKGKRVSAKGGMVVALGDDAAAARRLFHRHVREFFVNLRAESVETIVFRGENWYYVKTNSNFPSLLVGMKDSYLVVAIGEESPEPILQRMNGPIPKWLVDTRRMAGFQRLAGLTYINLRRLRDANPANAEPQREDWFEQMGLAQSPWVMSASGLVGPDVVTRTILPIEGQPRGLLLPAAGRGLRREDLAAIPRDATMALAARFDLQKTLDAVSPPRKPAAEGEATSAAETPGPSKPDRSSLPPDIFRSLGDTWCFYNSPKEGGMLLTGLTGVVPIGDRQQFSKHYEEIKGLILQSLPSDPFSGVDTSRIRRFPFAGGEVHYTGFGDMGLAPAWFAGEKQLVFALTPQSVKAYLSRPAGEGQIAAATLADVPEVAAEFSRDTPIAGAFAASGQSNSGTLLAVGYLDAPRVFETVYPLLMFAAPSYLGASGISEGRREISGFPSLPSVCRHLRPGVATLRRTDLGLELTSRGSMPGFGLTAPVMFMAWDSQWLNLVFGAPEDNAPPIPIPVAAPAIPAAVPAPAPPAPVPPAVR